MQAFSTECRKQTYQLKSHAFGVSRVTLTHSRSISASRCHAGGLKSHAFFNSRVMFHCFANSPTFEIFTSSAEESNPKSLPPNAFPGPTMPQKCVGGRALLRRTPLKKLTALSKSPSWTSGGRLATEKEKRKERWGRDGQG